MAVSRVFPFVAFVSFTGALAGLLFGMDTGAISGALPILEEVFDLSGTQQGWLASVLMVAAAFGAVGAAWFSSRFGRKTSLMLAGVLFLGGALLCAFAPGPWTIILGRSVLGLAIGIASFTAPLYLSEIAPERYRGGIISLYQLMITIGILMAFLLDTAFTYDRLWRWMLGVPAIPAACLLVAVFFLPRSPRWLAMKNRFDEAYGILTRLREKPSDAGRELSEIKESLKVRQEGWTLFKTNANFRRSVGLGVLLQAMQQFTGINVVMYFAPKIFELSGYGSDVERMWLTVVVGLINVLTTLAAIVLIDRWGRRPILYIGFLTMTVGMGGLAATLAAEFPSPAIMTTGVLMLMVFVAGFALSAGPIVWVLCSEIQPLKGRDFGIMCSTTTNWLANAGITFAFLPLLSEHGGSTVFLGLAVLNMGFILVTWLLVPETRGVSLEHIERNLMAGAPLRALGRSLSKDAS